MGNRLHEIQHKIKQSIGSAIEYVLFEVQTKLIFTLLILATIFWASYLPSLKFNYDIESFFASGDPEVEFYYNHIKTFENENDYVLLGIGNREGIFHQNFLEKLEALTNELKQFPGVKKVISPSNLYDVIKGPLGSIKIPMIHTKNPKKYENDKKRIYTSANYVNSFFSSDANSVSLLVNKVDKLSRKENDQLLYAINTAITGYKFDEFHVAGRIKTQNYYVTHMQEQMILFGILAIILFLGSLFLIFKCIKYVLLSFGAVLISQIWIFGIIGWMGIPLDLMLTILPTLIFVIGTSGSIHLITRFRNEYKLGVSKRAAIKASIIKTGMPNFLNAFTTAIGFASLAMIPVVTIQRFGVFTALGILISFFIGLLFIPTALKVMGIEPSKNTLLKKEESRLSIIDFLVFRKSKIIVGAFALVVTIGFYYSFSVRINNHFLDDLNKSSSLKQDLDFFEQNFSGIRPLEINISALNKSSILSYEALLEMDIVEKYIINEYKAGFIFSPLSYIKRINKAIHGGNHNYYKLPDSKSNLNKVLKLSEKQRLWKRFLPVITGDRVTGRITGRTTDEGSLIFAQRNQKLQKFLNENTSILKFSITGAAQLMDNANTHIAWNLMKGIFLAIVITTLVIGLFTQSWKLAALSLIPNVIPLLLAAGFMGAVGIPLKVSTSLIFTIVYGIAVDDTIHFLNSFRLNRKVYDDTRGAIKQTINEMWKPMLFTSIVLFSGFMIFLLSEFPSIAAFGFLIGGSLIIAFLTDILLMPVLLSKLFKNEISVIEGHIPKIENQQNTKTSKNHIAKIKEDQSELIEKNGTFKFQYSGKRQRNSMNENSLGYGENMVLDK